MLWLAPMFQLSEAPMSWLCVVPTVIDRDAPIVFVCDAPTVLASAAPTVSTRAAPTATFRGVRLPTRLRRVGGQTIGRHLGGVVDAASDDRQVRIALDEIDDDLLADARDLDEAPAAAGPGLRYAHEAGRVLVLLAEPV